MPDLQHPEPQEAAPDDIEALIEKNICGKCKAARLTVCKCKRAGGSGGGGGGSDSDQVETQAPGLVQNSMIMNKKYVVDESMPLALYETVRDSLEPDLFTMEEMAEFLSFSHDSKQGVITIRPKPSLLLGEKEIQELIQKLKKAFEQFKIALEKEGVPVDDFTITLNKNELIVRDTFIKELVRRNLLPKAYASNMELENQSSRLTPFTVTPKPSLSRKDEKEKDEKEEKDVEKEMSHESEENSGFNPSPFSFSLSLTKLFGGRS
ncbi:hypothetical protein LEAN103870_16195 [Legionella anisa]|uniref:Type IV secretion protein Dot n=1 Tax=Legionella anisa TaxID=28082 RepID=A0AAX0WRI7_9GAMM|nr:hypothetical protein [Legionella anisa]AWN75136.1 hypothetical protein DLD14_15550 [Legionella anisa]KTC68504.1 hypothetical protein Lani_3061 [Legionella anisa]MCW8424649.1 hypothetical protein [Legionella anisa]MCW8446232.1 hypothetical protein [Legionella anisa]PNL60909.1 hypothetical protein A6J39_006590 [Legionella anisa]